MPLRRGAAYQLVDAEPDLPGILVVSNDIWNDRMGTIVAVPLARYEVEPHTIPISTVYARAGRPVVFEDNAIGSPMYVCSPTEMDRVGAALADLFALEAVCREQRPPLPVGETKYPLWGEMYWAGDPVGDADERKRYVVVSNDTWNRRDTVASAVRLTSQRKGPGIEFPTIGTGHACCGDVTTFNVGQIYTSPRQRPTPPRLTTIEMARVAWGIVGALDLHAFVPR